MIPQGFDTRIYKQQLFRFGLSMSTDHNYKQLVLFKDGSKDGQACSSSMLYFNHRGLTYNSSCALVYWHALKKKLQQKIKLLGVDLLKADSSTSFFTLQGKLYCARSVSSEPSEMKLIYCRVHLPLQREQHICFN